MNQKLKIIIVDDEQESRSLLKNILDHYAKDVEILGLAKNISEAKSLIQQSPPDLLFLDIEMPGGTGFDLLSQLDQIPFEVVFVTGFDKYALNAIKINCLDYILKPIDIDDVLVTVEKARKIRFESREPIKKINNLLYNLSVPEPENHKITLPTQEGLELVRINDIIRFQSEEGYTWVHVLNEQPILCSKYLKDFETILEGYNFFRVHRMHFINMAHIRKYVKLDGGFVVMLNTDQIPVSRRKKEEFLSILYNKK